MKFCCLFDDDDMKYGMSRLHGAEGKSYIYSFLLTRRHTSKDKVYTTLTGHYMRGSWILNMQMVCYECLYISW